MNHKIVFCFLSLMAFFVQPILAEDNAETVVIFFHGMKQTKPMWEEPFNGFIKPMYKDGIKKGEFAEIPKGALKVHFLEGKVPHKDGTKLWFDLADNFTNDIDKLKKDLADQGKQLTRDDLIGYIRPEESGLNDAVRTALSEVKAILEAHRLSPENLILVGYSQGGIIASLVAQYLGSSCLGLILANSLYMPAPHAYSRPNDSSFIYNNKDRVISENVYNVSLDSLGQAVHVNDLDYKVFDAKSHDITQQQLEWLFKKVDKLVSERKAIF